MTRKIAGIVFLFFNFSLSFATPSLQLKKGTFSAGGNFSFPIDWRPTFGTSLSIDAEPKIGYFVADNFQLIFQAELKTPILEQRLAYGGRFDRLIWGFSLGGQYVFDIDWVAHPFVGFEVGYRMSGFSVSSIEALIGVPVGILLPMNDHIALNLGLRVRAHIVGQGKVVERVSIEPGYFGITGFI